MSSPLISRAIPLPQLTAAFGDVSTAYASVGVFSEIVEVLLFSSTFDEPVQISFDGVSDHLVIPAGSAIPVAVTINFKTNNMTLPSGAVFVKEITTPPTSGDLYVSAFSAFIP